jgi:hypothetical protein
MKSIRNILFFLSSSFLFIACGKKLPPEYKALEGVWQNNEVYMQISEDGGFSYKRQSTEGTVTIDTYIKEYSDKGFTVSLIFSSTDFVLDKKPYFDDSTKTTKIVVDGRTLVKQDNW